MIENAFKSKKKSIVVLITAMLLFSIILYAKYIFGNRLFMFSIKDIGSDTVNMYYPVYRDIVSKLRTGDFSFMSLNYGLGDQLLSYQSTIFDPFAVIIYATGLIFGDGAIAGSLIYVNILKIVCSGIAAYWLLDEFELSEYSKVTAAFVYAFNGFTILWGQHYFFATASVLMPLLLGAIERAVRHNRRFLLVSLSAFLFSLFSVYISFMAFIAAAFYFVIRYIQVGRNKFKDFLACSAKMIGAMLLGIGMAGGIFIPTAYLLMTAGVRISTDSSMFGRFLSYPAFYDSSILKSNVLRAVSNNLNGSATAFVGPLNYYELPQLSFSILFLMLLPTYFINYLKQNKSILKCAAGIVTLLIVLACVFSPQASLVLNMLQVPSQRYTFILMPVFAIVFAASLQKSVVEGKSNILMSCGATVLIAAVLLYAYKSTAANKKLVLALAAVTLMMLFCLILLKQNAFKSKLVKRFAATALLLLIVGNLAVDSFITVDHRHNVLKQYSDDIFDAENPLNKDLIDAVAYLNTIEKDNYYRIDTKYLSGSVNNGLIHGYSSVSAYHSNRANGYYYYLKDVQNHSDANILPSMVDVLDRDLAGVKYLLSTSDIEEDYSLIKQFGSVFVHQREQEVGVTHLYKRVIQNKDLLLMPIEHRKPLLKYAAAVENAETTSLGVIDANLTENKLQENAFKNTRLQKNGSMLFGEVSLQEDSLMVVYVPNQKGWTCTVDGKKAEIIQSNIAFMGVVLSKGEHTVRFEYNTPMLGVGMAVTVACVIIFILSFVLSKRKRV